MQGEEVADAVDPLGDHPVVARDHLLVDGGAREMADQLLDPVLDKEDPRRLERLDEAARQADRKAVLHPRVPAAAGPDLDVVGPHTLGGGSEIVAEFELRLLLEVKALRVDIPCTDPSVERDVPRPAVVHGGGGRVGLDAVGLDVAGDLQGDRAVAEERVGEGDEGLLERLVDQQPAETGAVDEEIAVDRAVPLGDDVIDAAVLPQPDLVDHIIGQCLTPRRVAYPLRYSARRLASNW